MVKLILKITFTGWPKKPDFCNKVIVKLLIEPHGALLEGVNDCSFKNRV